jgi:ABC-type multidrug transport system fused ATPase/permease subunit
MTKNNFLKRIIIGVLILALIVLMAVFVRLTGYGSGQITLVVPWGLIAIFISLYLFEEYNRVNKAKRENRREYMNQRRQELLDGILKKNKKSIPNSD